MLSNKIKNRFIKDYDLPFKLVKDPFFQYFVELYDKKYDIKTKLSNLENLMSTLDGDEGFFKASEDLKKSVQNHFLNHPDINLFKELDIKGLKKDVDDFERFKLYHPDNNGETFVSIDIVTANFQSFKFISPSLINNKESFKDFIKDFTDKEYFINSKRIRQIIFGDKAMNPSRQQSIQKYIMNCILSHFQKNNIVKDGYKCFLTSDELVINKKFIKSNFQEELSKIKEIEGIDLRIEEFTLNQVHPNHDFFIKKNKDESWALKNTPSAFRAEVYKFVLSGFDCELYKKSLHNFDRMFYNEKRICSYHDYLF